MMDIVRLLSFLIHKHKKSVKLFVFVEVLDYLLSQTRKPTDIAVSTSTFLSDSIEIVEIPVHLEKRKRFMSIC